MTYPASGRGRPVARRAILSLTTALVGTLAATMPTLAQQSGLSSGTARSAASDHPVAANSADLGSERSPASPIGPRGRGSASRSTQSAEPPVTNALPGCGVGIPAALVDSPPPPERKKLGSSPGGVDMRSGTLSLQNVDVAIGGEGDAGLSLTRSFSYKNASNKFRQAFGNFFTHNWDIQIQERRLPRAGACYPNQYDYSETVVYGDLGDNFVKSGNVGLFQQTAPFGYAELTFTGNGSQPSALVFTARDGTVVNFPSLGRSVCPGAYDRCGYASSIRRPDGTLYTLEYDTLADGVGKRLRSVVSNRGFALLFEYAGQVDGFQQTTKVCALNLAVTPKPSDNMCPAGVPTASYTYDGAVQTTATDAAGGIWSFGRPSASSFSLTRPADAQPYVVNAYSFVQGGNDDEPAFVIDSQQMATGQSYTYAWNILYNEDGQGNNSQQVIGGQWTDGQGRKVSAEFGAYFREAPQGSSLATYHPTPGPEVVTDELGRTTRYNYCGTVLPGEQCYIPPLQTVTDPEGNLEKFTYSAYNNIAEMRKIAKPNSGLPDLVEERTFDPGASPATRAKPVSTTDARGHVTDYSYYPAHGGVKYEAAPADANGIRPVKWYGYAQHQAWVANGAGGYAQDPNIVWLLATESACRTSATDLTTGDCAAGASDKVVTAYDYGPETGSVGNNLLVRGVAVTADGVTRRTCYGYDNKGNRIWETKPKAGLVACF